MGAVLTQKFRPGTQLAAALQQTGDSYLIEHNAVAGRDSIWSDNNLGDGKNWLGLQLMIIRDGLQGTSNWTHFAACHIDLSNGQGLPSSDGGWQRTVQMAAHVVNTQ